MKNVQLRNSFLLLLTAFIWGTSFVAQSVGTDYVQPYELLSSTPKRKRKTE